MLTLAWRNIWRHPRRTLLTVGAIGFACGVLMFFMGLQLSTYDTSINATARVMSGHLQIQRRGYLDKPQMESSINISAERLGAISAIPGIEAISSRANSFGILSSEEKVVGVQIIGVDPVNEAKLSTIPGLVREGHYLSSISAHQVVLGAALARRLSVGLGDDITILGQGRDGSLVATIFPVVGIFESGLPDIDRNLAYLPLGAFQEEFSMQSDVHSVVLTLSELSSIDLIQSEIAQILRDDPNLVTLRWDELMPGIKQSIQLDMAAGWLFYLSLVCIVIFCVLNTFLMSVLERTREFGVMLALGTRPLGLSGLIVVESFSLALLGILLGILLGGLALSYFGVYGFRVPGSEDILRQWNISDAVYPRFSLKALLSGPIIMLATTALAILYPVLRVLKLEPVSAMRSV